jgi:hypothetical protein
MEHEANQNLMAQIAAAMAKCDGDVEQARLAKEARENARMERAILAEVEARQRAAERDARARKDRKNAQARARRARNREARERALDAIAEGREPFTPPEPIPCPACGKMFPGVYGQVGVAMCRADNKTVICSECGTREAFGAVLLFPFREKMAVWAWLEERDSHEIYESDKVAADLLKRTGVKAPWTPRTVRAIRRQMANDPHGGTVSGPDDMLCIAGYEMAAALAAELCQFHSTCMGRGFLFRDCIAALRGNAK